MKSQIHHHGNFCVSNAKTVKGEKKSYLTAVLYLAPATTASRVNVCPFSSTGCRVACLNTAGRASLSMGHIIHEARKRKTLAYLANKKAFLAELSREIECLQRKAERAGMTLVVRPNGTSDIPALALALAEKHPDVQFYDYTKIPHPEIRQRPNYHLTFSRSERNQEHTLAALTAGVSICVVFAKTPKEALPATWEGRPVIDGDQTDLRFLDPRGSVIGVRAKGRAKKDTTGFVVRA